MLFGVKTVNAKFSLKLQFFRYKMSVKVTMSNHISNLRFLIGQLVEVKATVEGEDGKAILLNNLPSKYINVIFTLSKMSSQTLKYMIVSLLDKEKRTISGNMEGDHQHKLALYSRNNCSGLPKDKGEMECYFCKKCWTHIPHLEGG